jgi:O-antigen/teichoic acid export membrane protein
LLWPVLKSYGKWEIPQFLTSDFNGRIRPWLIKLFINTEAVGVFSVAYTFISAFKDLLPIRTLSILIPRKVHDKNYFNLFFLYGTKYYILMSLLVCFGSAATVPIAVHLLFPKYIASLPLFYLLLPLLPIFGFTKIINVLLVAKRRQKYIFFQSLLQYGLSFFFLILLLPTIGLFGLPLAEVLATISADTAKYYYLIKTKFIDKFPFKKIFSFGEQDRLILSILRHNLLAFFHKK